MDNTTFKQAYLNGDKVARAIGLHLENAFAYLVKEGLILEYSNTWFKMGEVAYQAHLNMKRG
jgi:hypothetical protein